ncbi:MAG: bifunctional diaminohydroxyphosphoribosylaminopyrimidine deaminase/5-amino-6-(5-phosphoribosylamino)uracil reductase RibD [Myxococcota bacterium]
MATGDDVRFMELALEEARRGNPSPNPRVGCVIVREGDILGRGHHAEAGQAHAEVAALANAGQPVGGATMYVTLEPCNHHGRTGPCTEAIIDAGVVRVVIGCRDPADHGPSGVERLRAAGIEVLVGVCEMDATRLVADFRKHHRTGTPFVTLKAAITLDGKLASRTGDSKWITGIEARTETHRMRAATDAILVGVGTVLADNPQLDVRHVDGPDPARVVLDANLRTPPDAKILQLTTTSAAPTWLFHADDAPAQRVRTLEAAGATLIAIPRSPHGVSLESVLRTLGDRDIVRLMVEGGAQVHGSFLSADLADRAALFIAPRIMGDDEAVSLARGGVLQSVSESSRLIHTEFRALGDDWLVTGDFERNTACSQG